MKIHRRRRAHAALLALAALTLAGCGSDSTSTTTTTGGSIAISLSNGALNITQGSSATTTVTVTRTTFTGAVTLSATGLPAGVTAANVTVGSSDTQGTLSLTATSTATAGAATVTIHATGTGVSEVTTTLALTVVASGGSTGGFTLSVTNPTFSVAAGASGNATVNITRTGTFTGAVNLTATTPTGITATFAPASATGATSTLTLAVGATVGTGPATITVLGNATGQAQQSATITLTVTASGGGGAGNVVWSFCSQSGLPTFLAMQDGAGAWTAVTGVSNAFTFTINSGKGGVAYVVPSAAGGFDTEVFFGTTSELQARGTNICNGTVGTGKTVTGTVSGTAVGDQVFVTLGRSQAIPTGSSFTLNNVLSGTLDLVASKASINLGPPASFVPSGIVIQRGLNVANNGSVGAVNFATGVTPASALLTANNLGTDNLIVGTSFLTANNTSAVLYSNSLSSAATQTWYGVPTASQVSGDIHLLSIIATAISGTITQTRQVLFASTAVTARTVTIGAPLAAPTVSVSATAPFVRLRIDHTVQSDYTQFFVGSFQQAAGTTLERLGGLSMTAAYAGSNTISLVMPDLSGAAGWDNNFGLKTGAATTWTLTAFGWTSGNFLSANPYTDGATYVSGTRLGTITP